MRKSTSYKPTNAFIISVQLDKETSDKLNALCKLTGMSASKVVRSLISAAETASPKISKAPKH